MKTIVIVDCMRHGKALTGAKGDKLLPEGVKQVLRSAMANLEGIQYQAFFSSMRHRALQTARLIALAVTGEDNIDINPNSGFDYLDEMIELNGGSEAMNKAARDHATARASSMVTIQDWMDAVPHWTSSMRNRVGEALLKIATEEASKSDQPDIHLLVASHSPVIDTAAVDMAAMPRLSEGDIIRYEIHVTDYGDCDIRTSIVASTFIHRGF